MNDTDLEMLSSFFRSEIAKEWNDDYEAEKRVKAEHNRKISLMLNPDSDYYNEDYAKSKVREI